MKKSIIAMSIFFLAGCGDEISLVKNSLINNNQPYHYTGVLDNRPVCEETKWVAYTERDHKYVKYSCLLKKGKTSLVYSAEDEKVIRRETKEEFISNYTAKHQKRLEDLQYEIAKGKVFVENFDSLTDNEKVGLIKWSIDNIKMEEILNTYAATPDGATVYNALWDASKGAPRRQHAPSAYAFGATSKRPEVNRLVKTIAMEAIGRYLSEIDKLIEAENTQYGNKNQTERLAENYANGQVDLYRRIYPLSRTETVIWTWNKLDDRYVIVDQYTDHKWFNEKKDHQSFCLETVVYAATHNVDDTDTYMNLVKGNLTTNESCLF